MIKERQGLDSVIARVASAGLVVDVHHVLVDDGLDNVREDVVMLRVVIGCPGR